MKPQLKPIPGRYGGAILTYSGRTVYPLNPDPATLCIEDIAHALSLICRFCGHIPEFYSVAEHSVRVVDRVRECRGTKEEQLWGLLHDASEAYLSDIVAPVKPFLEGYVEAESGLMVAICTQFKLPAMMPAIVHEADRFLYSQEYHDLRTGEEPVLIKRSAHPKLAERIFLQTYKELTAV